MTLRLRVRLRVALQVPAVRLREGAVRLRLALAGGGRPRCRRRRPPSGATRARAERRAAPTAWSWSARARRPWPWSPSACAGRRSCSPTAVPQQSFVGVLLDDSRSMRIADGGQPRGRLRDARRSARTARCCKSLAARFKLRFFRFAESTGPAGQRRRPHLRRRRRRIVPRALDRARQELRRSPSPGWCWSPTAPTTARGRDRRTSSSG